MSEKKSAPSKSNDFGERPGAAGGGYSVSMKTFVGKEQASERPTPSKNTNTAKPPRPSR